MDVWKSLNINFLPLTKSNSRTGTRNKKRPIEYLLPTIINRKKSNNSTPMKSNIVNKESSHKLSTERRSTEPINPVFNMPSTRCKNLLSTKKLSCVPEISITTLAAERETKEMKKTKDTLLISPLMVKRSKYILLQRPQTKKIHNKLLRSSSERNQQFKVSIGIQTTEFK